MRQYIIYTTFILVNVLFSCTKNNSPIIYTTTDSSTESKSVLVKHLLQAEKCDAKVKVSTYAQSLDGFGLSIKYRDWQTFCRLESKDRDQLLNLLFSSTYDGAKLSLLRLPINITNTYPSQNGIDSVSLDHSLITKAITEDSTHIMPYLKSILAVNKDAWIWMVPDLSDSYEMVVNRLNSREDLKQAIYQFYAKFAYRYIKSFYDAGVKIRSVSPKEKFNTAPNSRKNADILKEYIGSYLGIYLHDVDCEVWLGTICKCNEWDIDALMRDSLASAYISGISFRNADSTTLDKVTNKYSNLKQIHNSEFSDVSTSNSFWLNKWDQVNYYFKNDGSGYLCNDVFEYTSCPDTVSLYSSALVAIDTVTNRYKLSHKYYLFKHLSGFLRPGAKYIPIDLGYKDLIAFLNPDNSLVLVLANKSQSVQWPKIDVQNYIIRPSLPPRSISTIVFAKDNGFFTIN